jgi:hypothetical protein
VRGVYGGGWLIIIFSVFSRLLVFSLVVGGEILSRVRWASAAVCGVSLVVAKGNFIVIK